MRWGIGGWGERRTGLLVQGLGRHLDVPGAVGHRVGDARLDAAEHTEGRVGGVEDGEGDGLGRKRRHIEGAERPVVGAAVQRVVAVVLLRLVRYTVNRVLPLADPVGVPAGDGVVHWVTGVLGWECVRFLWVLISEGLLTIVGHIVVAEDHVNVLAILVLDKQVRQGGAVRDELSSQRDSRHLFETSTYLGFDARRRNGVAPILIWPWGLAFPGDDSRLGDRCHEEQGKPHFHLHDLTLIR